MKIIHSLGFYFHCTVLENKTSKWCMITNYRQFLTFTFSTLMYIFTVTTVTSLCLPNARSWAFPPYLIFSLTLVFFLFNDTSLTHLQDFISFCFLHKASASVCASGVYIASWGCYLLLLVQPLGTVKGQVLGATATTIDILEPKHFNGTEIIWHLHQWKTQKRNAYQNCKFIPQS